jgi:streptogramin lyase
MVILIITLILLSAAGNAWASPTQRSTTRPSAVQATAASLAALALTEWTVPSTGGGPWGITLDSSGKIWFTENAVGKLARFDPSSNNFTEWSIPSGGNPRYVFAKDIGVYFTEYTSNKIAFLDNNNTFYEWQLSAGSNPVGIYVDQNNTIWFTESGRDAIGRLVPSTNSLTEWTLPGATINPGTPVLEPWGIYVQPAITGPYFNITDRLVWFTETASNTIGMLQVSNNLLTLWHLNTVNIIPGLNYGPMDITIDSASPGNVIFADSAGDRISILDNGGPGYHEYGFPPHMVAAKPTSVKVDTTRGLVWFTEYNTGIIGNVNTTSFTVDRSFLTPSRCTLLPASGSNMCPTPSGSIVTTASLSVTHVVATTTTVIPPLASTIPIYQSSQAVTEYRLPNAAALPNSVTLDSSGNVWFTESNTTVNRIGRLAIPYVFQLSVSPAAQTVIQGQSVSYGVSVNLLSGTPMPVQLSLTNAPSTINVIFTPQSGTPTFTSTLTVATTNSTPTGIYAMNVMATSGGQSKSSAITLTVQPPSFDFGIQIITANSVTTPQGGSAMFQIRITLSRGNPNSVTLTATGFPARTTYSFTTTNGFPPFTTTLNIQTDVDTPPGSYAITITGTSSDGITHNPSQTPVLQITQVTRDFGLTASANEVTLVQASRTDMTLTITSIGSFNGNVTLNGGFSPSVSGLTATFSPSWATPQPNGGSSQVTMTIVATKNAPAQTYQLTVTGTSTVPSRTHLITLTVRVSPCLIATAAFGSELAPEVQFLRTFRDEQVIRTFAGSNFMTVFNAWYYSFSPAVAQFEYSHATARMIIRVTLYPLIGILHLSSLSYAMLASQPELAVLTTGIIASFLIGVVYVAFPISCILWITKKQIRARNITKLVGAGLIPPIIAFVLAEAFVATWLMMIASVAIVLTTLTFAGALGVSLMLTYIKSCRSSDSVVSVRN